MRRRLNRFFVPLVLVLSLGGGVARAEEEEREFHDPDVAWMDQGRPWAQWLAGSLFVVGVMMLAFKNPHRSHLD